MFSLSVSWDQSQEVDNQVSFRQRMFTYQSVFLYTDVIYFTLNAHSQSESNANQVIVKSPVETLDREHKQQRLCSLQGKTVDFGTIAVGAEANSASFH